MKACPVAFKLFSISLLVMLGLPARSWGQVTSNDPNFTPSLLTSGLNGPLIGPVFRPATNDIVIPEFSGGAGGQVVLVDATTGAITSLISQSNPTWIAVRASDGLIAVGTDSAGPISFYSSTGGPQGTTISAGFAGTGTTCLVGLAFDSAGNFYVATGTSTNAQAGCPSQVSAESSSIYEFAGATPWSATGSLIASGMNALEGLTFSQRGGPSGSLFAVSNFDGSIYQVVFGGEFTSATLFATAPSPDTRGIALDPSLGDIYVTEFTTGEVFKLPNGSSTFSTFATGFTRPAGLGFDSAGNLYVDDSSTSDLWKFTRHSFATPQQPIAQNGTNIFTDLGIMDLVTQWPGNTNFNGAFFMAVNFMNVAQNAFDSTRLPSEGQTTPNTWSGGTAVPAGTTCTIIKGTGPSGTGADDTCVVAENLCFDSNHNLLSPTPPSPDSCDIIAPTGPAGNKILLTSHYVTTAPVNQALIIASDGANDWANITGDPTICCTISGGTNGINSDEAIVNLPYTACLLYDPNQAVKSGAVIPLKMYLCDAANGSDLSSSSIVVTATRLVKTTSTTTDLEILDAGNANPDSNFRFDAGQGPSGGYIFNLKTTGLGKGQYLLFYTVGSDPEHQLGAPNFSFSFQVK